MSRDRMKEKIARIANHRKTMINQDQDIEVKHEKKTRKMSWLA